MLLNIHFRKRVPYDLSHFSPRCAMRNKFFWLVYLLCWYECHLVIEEKCSPLYTDALGSKQFCHYYSSCFRRSGQIVFFLKSKTQVKSHCFLNLIIVSCRASSRTAKVSNQTSLVTTGRIFCVDLFSLIKFEVKKDLIHESPLPGKFYSKASVKIQLLSKYT